MAISVGVLSANVVADTRMLVQGLNKAKVAVRDYSTTANALLQANAQAMIQTGKKAMMMGAAIGAGAALAVKGYANLEQAMATATAVGDVTEKQLRDMTSMAEEMSKKWGVSAAETAQAFYFLGSAGLEAQEQIAAFPAVTTLAKAAMMDMGSAAEITVDTMKGFKIAFTDTTRVTDILTKAVTSSNMTFGQLGEAMSYVAGIARTSNMTLEETSAVLGLMANVGIKGSMAGTSLRRALINLSAPSSEASRTLKELGVEVYDDTGKMKSFSVILANLVPKLQKAGDETSNMAMKQLFGARAIIGMTELVYQGAEGLRAFTTELENSGGTAERVAEKQIDTLTGSFRKLGQETVALVRIFGADLSPAVDTVTKRMTEFVASLEKMPAGTRKVIEVTALLSAGILVAGGAMLVFLGHIGLAITGIGKLIAHKAILLKLLKPLTIGFKLLGKGLATMAGTMGAVVAVGGGFIAMLIKWRANWQNLKVETEAMDKAMMISHALFNKLNKAFIDGTITGKQYERGLKGVNITLKEMGKAPMVMPKHIKDMIEARRETDKLTKSIEDQAKARKGLLGEMIGAFAWKPPAMAMGGGPAMAMGPTMGGMDSSSWQGAGHQAPWRGFGQKSINLTINVDNAREAGREVERELTNLGALRE